MPHLNTGVRNLRLSPSNLNNFGFLLPRMLFYPPQSTRYDTLFDLYSKPSPDLSGVNDGTLWNDEFHVRVLT